jgi:phosphoesterase RecJ-like protein
MLDLFSQLEAEAHLYVAAGELLPLEDVLFAPGAVVRGLPPAGAALYALDSGSPTRLALPEGDWPAVAVNIDHHHDNPCYGEIAYLRGSASSASELVCDVARALGLRPGPQAALALYAGISFDTGHFRHGSTRAGTFATAAWLAELGVDVTAVYELLYEQRSLAALLLWAKTVAGTIQVAGGRALIACARLADYEQTGAGPEDTEGVVDSLRSVAGVDVAAFLKEQPSGPRVRGSLRSNACDVSAVAALKGGGGHRLAAGFSSDDSIEEVIAWLSSELERRLSTASS